jgi:choline-glycine betaine transporter
MFLPIKKISNLSSLWSFVLMIFVLINQITDMKTFLNLQVSTRNVSLPFMTQSSTKDQIETHTEWYNDGTKFVPISEQIITLTSELPPLKVY